jgi:Glycoside Hydrolase Family 113
MLVNGDLLLGNSVRRKWFSRSLSIIVLLSLLVPVQGLRATPPSLQPDTSFKKGLSFAAWWAGQYSDPGADISLEALKSTGADWISLIVTGYQDTQSSTTIDLTSQHTPTDADLIHVIQQAHGLGLKVMLKPHVDLLNETAQNWRGDIGTDFTTEAQWSAWFTAYRNFIEHYARLAQANGVDQFSVGTELEGTTQRAADWRTVVAGVRAIFSGPLTYAALHGGEETSITWWDAVDYIGVDAYYPLADDITHHPTEAELEARWQVPKTILANLAAQYDKSILLTEIGYRSQHGCSDHPWDSVAVSPVDLEEQAFAYQAAFRQLYGQPWLAGMFWWTWHADRFKSGPCDDSYSPHLKPAEDVLRAWYGGAPRPVQPILFADYDHTLDVYTEGLAAGWQDWSWSATVNQAATDQVYRGAQSVSATLSAWGALSLVHPTFSPGQYYWLEFYVRGSSSSQFNLWAFFDAKDGTRLPPVPVNDCRYIEGGKIDSTTWRRVRIPLSDLNVPGLDLTRLSIQNQDGQKAASFWIDDIRLVGATKPIGQVFLPLVMKSP